MPLPRPTWRYEDRVGNVPDGYCVLCGHGVQHGDQARAIVGARPGNRALVVCAVCAIDIVQAIEEHPAGLHWLAKARLWLANVRLKAYREQPAHPVPQSRRRSGDGN